MPSNLATAKPHQCRRLRNSDPIFRQIAENIHAINLRTAHQNHRHRPPTFHPIRKPERVTSLSGPMVTSLSGVYILDSQNSFYEIFPVATVLRSRHAAGAIKRSPTVRRRVFGTGAAEHRAEHPPGLSRPGAEMVGTRKAFQRRTIASGAVNALTSCRHAPLSLVILVIAQCGVHVGEQLVAGRFEVEVGFAQPALPQIKRQLEPLLAG
jgi:hypothetical protein